MTNKYITKIAGLAGLGAKVEGIAAKLGSKVKGAARDIGSVGRKPATLNTVLGITAASDIAAHAQFERKKK